MALKTKQRDLKKIIHEQASVMALKCAECLGFFVDGYETCTSEDCSLLPYFPTVSYISQGWFVIRMKEKAKELGNSYSFIKRVTARQKKSSNRPKKPASPLKH